MVLPRPSQNKCRAKTSAVDLYRNVTYFGTEEYLLQFKRLLLSHLEMHKGGTNIHLADSVEFLEVMHKDRRYKLPRTNKTDIRCQLLLGSKTEINKCVCILYDVCTPNLQGSLSTFSDFTCQKNHLCFCGLPGVWFAKSRMRKAGISKGYDRLVEISSSFWP